MAFFSQGALPSLRLQGFTEMLLSLYQDSTKPWGNHFSDEYTQRHFKIAIPNILKILQMTSEAREGIDYSVDDLLSNPYFLGFLF